MEPDRRDKIRIVQWKHKNYRQGCKDCYSIMKDLWDRDVMNCDGCPGQNYHYIEVMFDNWHQVEVFAPNEKVAGVLAQAKYFEDCGDPHEILSYRRRESKTERRTAR